MIMAMLRSRSEHVKATDETASSELAEDDTGRIRDSKRSFEVLAIQSLTLDLSLAWIPYHEWTMVLLPR